MVYLNWITRILGIAAGAIAVYLFLENRKLRIFDIDEQLEQLDIKEQEVGREYRGRMGEAKHSIPSDATDSLVTLGIKDEAKEWHRIEFAKIEARRKHLLKTKKYKWFWSKVD